MRTNWIHSWAIASFVAMLVVPSTGGADGPATLPPEVVELPHVSSAGPPPRPAAAEAPAAVSTPPPVANPPQTPEGESAQANPAKASGADPVPGAESAAVTPGAASVDTALSGPPGTTLQEAEVIEAPARGWREWYALGGWIMHLLVACSAIVLAVTGERLWRLRSSAVFPRKLAEQIRDAWKRGRIDEVESLRESSKSSLSRLVRAALDARIEHVSPTERVSAAGEVEAGDLNRNLSLLSAFANIATMLGLLGTVLGMIQAFDLIAVAGTGDARIVARGIFQALVTTAAGLSVGIVALGVHAYLRRRVESLLADLGDFAEELCHDDDGSEPSGAHASAPGGALAAAS